MRGISNFGTGSATSDFNLLWQQPASREVINLGRSSKDLVSEVEKLLHRRGWNCSIDRNGHNSFSFLSSSNNLLTVQRDSADNYDLEVKGYKPDRSLNRSFKVVANQQTEDEFLLSKNILSQSGKDKPHYQSSMIARAFYHYLESKHCSCSDMFFRSVEKIAAYANSTLSLPLLTSDLDPYLKRPVLSDIVIRVVPGWLEKIKQANTIDVLTDTLFKAAHSYQEYLKGKIALDPEQLKELRVSLRKAGLDLSGIEEDPSDEN